MHKAKAHDGTRAVLHDFARFWLVVTPVAESDPSDSEYIQLAIILYGPVGALGHRERSAW